MPKRTFALAVAALAISLAACNSTNVNSLYGTPTPVATATPSLTPNPSATAALVKVTVSNAPQANQEVDLYASDATKTRGAFLSKQFTDSTGSTTFTGLTPAAYYCFASQYQPAAPGSLLQQASVCTNLWGITGAVVNLSF